jgi:hypothetical protein
MNIIPFIVGRQMRILEEVGTATTASVLRLRDGKYYDPTSGRFSSDTEILMATHNICLGVRGIELLPAQQERSEDDLLVHFSDGQFSHLIPVGRATQLDTMERDIRDLWSRKDSAMKQADMLTNQIKPMSDNVSELRRMVDELNSEVNKTRGATRGGT